MQDMKNLCFNCFHDNPNGYGTCPYCGYDNDENRAKYPIALKSGSILNGQYIVGRVLGQGGFGITYLSLDYRLNIKVAIKEYIPDGMATRLPETTLVTVYAGEKKDNFYYGSERFLDEARILARFIGNKNITAVKCFFEENNTVYFVMDYVEGISFKNYIKNRGGRVDYTDALRVLVPVMDALIIVHREGLIHRDVTPDNIYITKDDEIKLLDFGSARYSLGDKSKSLDVILKAGYAPKEQYIKRGRQGPYTDVYSLSACFYASITGFLPPESLERLEEDEIVSISAHGIRIPEHLEAAVMKGLAVRAEDRWQSVEEFKAAILGEVTSEEVLTDADMQLITDNISSHVASISPVLPVISLPEQATVTDNDDVISNHNDIPVIASTEAEQPNSKGRKSGYQKRSKFRKYRAAALISASACIILIAVLIILVNNRSGYSMTSTIDSETTSTAEETTEVSQIETDTFSGLDKPEPDITEEEQAAEDQAAADQAAADQAAADQAAADKAAADKAAADKAAADKAAADKAAADKAAADKAAAEKAAAKKAAAEKAAAEKAAAEKAAAEKAAAEKAAEDKAAAEKAAAKKAAAEKAAAEKAAAEKAAECPYCDGTGKVECPWCEGTGICMETYQEDNGEYIYEGDPCPKNLTCDWCDGTGRR